VAVPGAVARLGWRETWLRAWAVMVAMNLVDIDHLFADAVFEPNRCSVGFHPLHSWPAQGLWVGLALHPKTRLVGVGALLHMGVDAIDCAFMG
jgi:hypothetical protein